MFAVQNGVVTYNGVPTVDLTPEQIRRMYGTAGDILHDPRYRVMAQVGHGDVGFIEEEKVDPEAAQRLYRDGQWYRQVGPMRSVGGEGEVSDPSKIVWDDELGYITPMSNVREVNDMVTPGMMLAAVGMLGAIGMAGGFSGLLGAAGGSSGFPAGAGIAGPSLETAGVATGALEGAAGGAAGAGAASGASLFPPGAGPGIGGPLLETAGAASSSPNFLQQLLAQAQANPMMATRALLGAANLANSFGGSSNNTTPGLMGGTPGTAPALNFTGLLNNYKPMQFDPVPFMSGRYGG